MAFTRSFLKSLALTDEQLQAVMEEHVAVTDALKQYKADAERLSEVQKELDDLKKSTADYESIKQQYADEKKAFEDFKRNVEAENARAKTRDAYKALLKAQNIDDKRIDAILKVTNFDEKKLGKDGKFENESDLVSAIKSEWNDFIVTKEERGAEIETPPANTGGKKLTKDDIMKIKDTAERQKAIAENPDLFNIG